MKSLTSIAYKTMTAFMIVMLALTALPATPAYAAVGTATAWYHAPSGTIGPFTITNANFSCGAGINRLLVAVVTAEKGAAGTMGVTANKGAGINFTQVVVTTGSFRTGVWIGYLLESQINGNINSVTITRNGGNAWTSSDVYLACYTGVDQTTPIVPLGTNQAASDGNVGNYTFNNIPAVNTGMMVYAAGHNSGNPMGNPTGYSEPFDLNGSGSYRSSVGYKAVTATGNESGTVLFGSNDRYAAAVISINPLIPPSAPTSFSSSNATTFTVGAPNTFTITANGFPAPTYAIQAGALPLNVTFSAAGVLSGTPVAGTVNTYPITIRATNASGFLDQNFTLTVDKANTTIAITSDTPDPSLAGQNVTVNFSITSAGNTITPTGNVTISDGVNSCTSTVAGAASPFTGSCVLALSTVGPRTLTASYPGDANFNAPTNATNGHTVNASFTITLITGTGGTIQSPYGTVVTGSVTAAIGSSPTFYFVPSTGFIVNDVNDSGSLGRLNALSIPNINANHTITVTFDGGWSDPNGNANNNVWTNPQNMYTSNNVFATVGNFNTQTVDLTTFGIPVIPAGSTIDGIEVAVEGFTTGRQVTVQLSGNNGGSWTLGSAITALGATEQTDVIGGATDLWGIAWTPASFTNANFRLRVLSQSGGFTTVSLDQVQVKVHYRQPTTLTVLAATGAYGGTVDLTGTLLTTTGSNPVSGQTVTFYLNGTSVGTALTNASGIATLTGVSLAGINAGAYTGVFNTSGVTASYTGTAAGILPGYLASAPAVNTLTVNKAVLTVTANDKSREYGLANPPLDATITGFVNGELIGTSDVTGSPVCTTTAVLASPVSGSPYPITCIVGTLASTNYSFNFAPANLTITQATLDIAASNDTMVYGGTVPTITPIYSGLRAGDLAPATPPTCTTTATSASPVGSYPSSCIGAADPNYTIGGYTDGTVTVTKAVLTVTANDQTRLYGAADPAFDATITGFVNGDTLLGSVSGAASCISTAIVSSPVSGSPYTITCTVGALTSADYSFSFVTGNLTITSANLLITASSGTMVYGGIVPTITPIYSGLQAGDSAPAAIPTCSTTAVNTSPVGSYPSTCSVIVDTNYNITYAPGIVDVTQASLLITASSGTMVYGGIVPTITPIYSGLQAGDSAPNNLPTCSTTATNTSSVGSYPSNCIGAVDANYLINYAPGNVNVTAAVLTVTANSDTKIYDNIPYSGGAGVIYSGFVAGDDENNALGGALAYSGSSQGAVNQGGYAITPGGLTANNGNYTFNYFDGTLTITQSALLITANDDAKTYDGVAYSGGNGVTYSGFAVGDNAGNALGGVLAYSGTSQGAVNQGAYIITPSGLTANNGNYTISYANGTLTIGLNILTVTANDDAKTYDGNPYAGGNGVTYSGFAVGDNETNALGGLLIYTGTSQGAVNQGAYIITPGGLTAANYTIVFMDGALNINPLVLTVTAVDDAKAYDGIAYSGGNGVTYSGFALGDNESNALNIGSLAYSGSSQGAVNQGSYAITPGGLTANNGNYTFSYQNGTLAIAPIALTVTANDDNKIYDSIPYAGGNGVIYSGFALGDNAGNSLGGALAYTGASQGAVNQGSYIITPGGLTANNGNYTINYANGALTIGQRPITVTAVTDTKAYDGNTSSIGVPTITSGTLVGTDAFTLTQTFDTKDIGTNKVMIPLAVISVGDANNYLVNYVNDNTGVIAGVTVTVSGITANNKIYDGDAVASLNTGAATLVGVAIGDDVQLDVTGAIGAFANKNVGNGKNVTVSGLVLTGADAANYGLIAPAGIAANITTRPITVTAQTNTKIYDGNTSSATVPIITAGALAAGDTEAFTQAYATQSVGTSKTLTPTGAVIDGNGGGNYLVLFANDTTGVINAQPIEITANPQAKAFGDPDPALTYSITNGSLVSGDSLSGSLTRVGGEAVGSYAILQGSVSAGSNYNLTYVGANLTISIVNQTITVVTHALATAAFNSNFNVVATASSGLPVAITTTGAACTGNGSTSATIIMLSGTGICAIHFNQAGNVNFGPALEVIETTNAQKADQTIGVNTSAPANATYNTGFNVAATATSGLPVAYTSSGVCTNAGSNYTVTSGTGVCTVQYNQAGNANYNAAPQVTQTVNAQKANQNTSVTISAPANAAFNSNFTVAATSSSGLPVAYSSTGSCSNAAATFTMTLPSGICTVQYNQAGNANYNAAILVTQTVNAQKANQTITVTTSVPASAANGTVFPVAATANSGLPVAITTSGFCTGSGTGSANITMTSGTGACTVLYNQIGNANYNAAPQISESTNSLKANQVITVNVPAPVSAINGAIFNVAATSNSGLTVAITTSGVCTGGGSGLTAITMTSSTGVCSILFNQAGDTNYNPAPQATNTTNAQKTDQTITVTTPAPVTSANGSNFTVAATSSSGLPVAYSATGACANAGATFTMTAGTGVCTVHYNQTGDANYNLAPEVTTGVTAQKGSQTINVTTSAPASAVNSASFNVAATSSSGLAVAITTSGDCSGSGSGSASITITSAPGTCIVHYNQAGDADYNPATEATEDTAAVIDSTAPTVTVNQAATQVDDPTNVSPINFTVVFSETVTGFTASDVTIGGTAGATTATITGAGPTYNVAISGMTNDGAVTISIPAGAVTDVSSNTNAASSSTDNTVTYLDANGPTVQVINTSPETGDHVLSNAERVTFNITQFTVQFNQDVYDPAGDSDAKDVTNPNNYLLIRDLGDTAGLQTISCSGGAVVPADTKITIGTVTYDNETYTATFTVNSGLPLSNGDYHLFICGTTSIVDPLDNALALVGSSGQPNSDFRRSFTVSITGNGGGGNNNGGNNNNTAARPAVTTSNAIIPVTGFNPNQVTILPKQPADRVYNSLDDIRIEIPTLGINFPIVGVPETDNGWNLTWLKDNVGYLESSAYPTFNGNTVLTAHVRDANKNVGPFSDIKGMRLGDRILIHAYGKIYVYEVQENTKILPNDISTAFKHEEYAWITLVTCEDYNAKIEEYYHRRMVRAVLVSVVEP